MCAAKTPAASTTCGTVGILGAGTMGTGIAQVATLAGWHVRLIDRELELSTAGKSLVTKRLERLVEKGRINQVACDDGVARLNASAEIQDLGNCDLVIEAIVEDLNVKADTLGPIAELLAPDAVIATNTSSLSVSDIADAIKGPERVVGMHFFNPAALMPLVEIIRGKETTTAVADQAAAIANSWGKTVVRASDTPGFIVNRVARPYYLEAWRIYEDGYADVETIDQVMRDSCHFKMGPFELTDLIGQDVNTATTKSVWERLDCPARLAPSEAQEGLVAKGNLGRKTKLGCYDYTVDPPASAIERTSIKLEMTDRLQDAVSAFSPIEPQQHCYIAARIMAAIINEAAWAASQDVATTDDIDTALRLGTNYPKGPFEWATEVGADRIVDLLETLNTQTQDGRFQAPANLASIINAHSGGIH